MAADPDKYLAVLKASYNYDPQPDAEDEIAIKENQLLFLLERTDEDWWKVKPKLDSQDEEGPTGLVPSAYVETADPIQIVKALYDYEATQSTELTVKEEEILYVYDKDEDWILVQAKSGESRVGYVPGNYVEEVSEEAEEDGEASSPAPAPASLSSIVVPDSPPQRARPVSAYVDPADLVAATSNKAQADAIQTWSISEVDGRGKKKKGTLGIGNGAMFFASESDKNPVRKWQMDNIESVKIEKSKHVHIDVSGDDAVNLHFHAGSKDNAEAIRSKLESSRALVAPASIVPAANESSEDRPRLKEQKSVHFAQDEPDVIPPSEAYGEQEEVVAQEEEEEEEPEVHPQRTTPAQRHVPAPPPRPPVPAASPDGPVAMVLYNFTAAGDDELTVTEGQSLVVLEKDSDEWWKVRDDAGAEGVVPASYVEFVESAAAPSLPTRPTSGAGSAAAAAAAAAAAERAAKEAAREEEEEEERRAEAERELAEKRKKEEAEKRAKAAAAAADADRKRREREREKQKEKEKERERAAAEEEAKRRKHAEEQRRTAERRKSMAQSRSSMDEKRGPPAEALREWHDRTGQFRVDAAFLGFANGKLRLHKINGVVIEVPAEKMSEDDLRYVQKITKQRRGQSSHRRSDDDDEMPLELIKQGLSEKGSPPKSTSPPKPQPQQPKKGPTVDWFEFFLNAGCDIDDCTRYASSFERDKIDEAILPDITESTMRSLGLREGDIIRVKKAIETRKPKPDPREEQLLRDEELARQLQAEETGSSLKSRSPAPNLFAGSNGELKNMRRGRPQPSKSLTAAVDMNSITTVSDQIKRGSPPMVSSPDGSSAPAPLPSKATPAAPVTSGFDDDAWTNRPSSTKPAAPELPVRAPSTPPAPPPPPAPPAPSVTVSPPPRPATVGSSAPAQPAEAATNATPGSDADIFNQLARIASLRVSSPVPPQPASAPPQTMPQRAPSVSISPPVGFQSGMGMGSSPVPMGAALQAQQTGILPLANGPRGPFAPVPANQSLLQPLVPTTTGFNGFVPARPGTAPIPSSSFHAQSPFQSAPPPMPSLLPQQTGFVQSGFQTQPTGFQPQPTGFQPQPTGFQPQPTGFQPQPSFMSQPTGMPNGGFGGVGGGLSPFQSTPSFNPMQSNPTGYNPVQSNPTGFGPSFGQAPLGGGFSSPAPPPPPPAPPQPAVNTNPANIFASMKSGTFAQEDSAPQSSDRYDALRPNATPLTVQQTGWGTFGGVNGFQGGGGYGY